MQKQLESLVIPSPQSDLAAVEIHKKQLSEFRHIPRDESYYRNPQIVKEDLRRLAAELDVERFELIKISAKLTRTMFRTVSGDEVNGVPYLRQAAQAMGLSEKSATRHQDSRTLLELKKIAGYLERDVAYYFKPENLKMDLESLRAAYGLESVDQIRYANTQKFIKFDCSNGDAVSAAAYLAKAGRLIGISGQANTINQLKIAAGYLPEEAEHPSFNFGNLSIVREDLISFAMAAGFSGIGRLREGSMRNLHVNTFLGGYISGTCYLQKAVVSLGFAANSAEATPLLCEVLSLLKEKCGYLELGKKYFDRRKLVRVDLEQFGRSVSRDFSDVSLNRLKQIKIQATNGDILSGRAYICFAAVAMGLCDSAAEADKYGSLAMEKLQDIWITRPVEQTDWKTDKWRRFSAQDLNRRSTHDVHYDGKLSL